MSESQKSDKIVTIQIPKDKKITRIVDLKRLGTDQQKASDEDRSNQDYRGGPEVEVYFELSEELKRKQRYCKGNKKS
jgi:hypothetical protein